MNGVLRIALACFAMAPVQRWVNGAGLILLAVGAVLGFTGNAGSDGGGLFACLLLGVLLLVLTPAFAGGVALRFASTRSLMNLRPNGRLRMVLGATLAITLLAALTALPSLTLEWYLAAHGRSPGPRHVPSLDFFMGSWAVLALAWISLFAISRSVLMMALIGLLPIVVISALKVLGPLIPNAVWLLVPGIACWGLFAAWYLQTDFIKRPEFPLSGGPAAGPEGTPHGRLLAFLLTPRGELSRHDCMRFYLFGSASPLFFVLTGAWVALIFLALQFFVTGGFKRAEPMVGMMPFIAFFNISLGYATARRARLLWLRTELDRAGLFRLAERWGQRAAMTTWLVAAAAIVVPTLLLATTLVPALLLYVAMQGAVALALYYVGMAMIRDWSPTDVLLCVVLALLVVTQAVYFIPRRDPTMGLLAAALLTAGVSVLLLRAYAAWRWRGLDWRVAQMPRMGMRS